LVGKSHWRGALLDGAALAAQQLGRPDVSKRLEAAWRAVPTLTRLLRWLVADSGASTAFRAKAKKIVARCPRTAGRQLGLLLVLLGDLRAAAALLSKAPGLGWSSDDHPGHVLFPLFTVLLANGARRTVSDALLAELESTSRDPLEVLSDDDVEKRPRLALPSFTALAHDVRSTIEVDQDDREAMLGAMRIAAERRIQGILSNSRRRYYGHAAMLAASCFVLAPTDRHNDLSAWLVGLRQTYSRRHAFREELTRALESLGTSLSD
jgi:hypothetical protein